MSSLVLALGDSDKEIVVASDRLGYTGEDGGRYKFNFGPKVMAHQGWLYAFTGTEIGKVLYERCVMLGGAPNDINEAAVWLADKTRGEYDKYERPEDTELMLAGFFGREPRIYTWKLYKPEGKRWSAVEMHDRVVAIGAKRHGALYFANAYLSKRMNTEQRIQLAHFCVSEVGKYDPGVSGVDISVVRHDGVEPFSDERLAGFRAKSAQIATDISTLFR